MTYTWGRAEGAGAWPRPRYLWTIGALIIALAAVIGTSAYRYTRSWTPLQRLYLSHYLRTQVAGLITSSGTYRMLLVERGKGRYIPLNEDVDAIQTPDGKHTLVLSDLARQFGARRLIWRVERHSHTWLYEALRRLVYYDQTLTDLVRPSLWGGLATLIVGLLVAIPKDAGRVRARRHGERLKGPELVTPARFNRLMRSNGIGFELASGWFARLLCRRSYVRLPYALEPSHMLIMGDTGSGKSSLIRQVLEQLDARGDTAIVYDPALDYTAQFYRPERGDIILNPLDARCPYWSPGDEVRDLSETTALAAALFQSDASENKFFVEAPRRVFGHLLTYRPSAQDIVRWLSDPEELARRVRGTPYAAMIDVQAPSQSVGVRSSLNLVVDALQLLPTEAEARGRWSATQWSQQRQGWIFLPSQPETRERLTPLTSLWLDLLILRLLRRDVNARRVWFVLDELASLHRLPQLHTAITENRKSNCPLILGFQGRSQLETRYGHDAETMLSQPATKIFLATSEARAAEWVSNTIGEIEVERLRESRASGRDRHQSYALERHREPLVMGSEIEGLPPLLGFMKVQNLVVRLDLPLVKAVPHELDIVPRPLERQAFPTPADAPSRSTPETPATNEPATPAGDAPSPSERKPKPFFR